MANNEWLLGWLISADFLTSHPSGFPSPMLSCSNSLLLALIISMATAACCSRMQKSSVFEVKNVSHHRKPTCATLCITWYQESLSISRSNQPGCSCGFQFTQPVLDFWSSRASKALISGRSRKRKQRKTRCSARRAMAKEPMTCHGWKDLRRFWSGFEAVSSKRVWKHILEQLWGISYLIYFFLNLKISMFPLYIQK